MRGDPDAAGDASSLLVVIDMQRIFGDPESPWFTPGYAGIVPNVNRLVAAFGDRVVFTRFLVPDDPRGSWAAYYERFPQVARPEARPLFALTEPWAGRQPPTLDEPTFSKWGPALRTRAGPAETLVLAGVATDCCVIGTALPAADAGMFVRVVGDACAGIDDAAHERALAICAGFAPQIVVTTVEEELRT